MTNINHQYIELTRDAAAKAYWFKQPFRDFLRSSGVSDNTISSWAPDESKKVFLNKVFERILKAEKGPIVLDKMAKILCEKEYYQDLESQENSSFKIASAKEARDRLKSFIKLQTQAQRDEKEASESRRRAEELRLAFIERESDLAKLETRLNELSTRMGSQGAGYEFETWFYDLMSYYDITHRRPYISDGRQIDGSISVDGSHYLVELKFTTGQSGAEVIDSIKAKVDSKIDNTMGIIISISGYSSVAVSEADKSRLLLLLDVNHIFLALKGILKFQEIVERVRRHASQTGHSYLLSNEFGH